MALGVFSTEKKTSLQFPHIISAQAAMAPVTPVNNSNANN